LESAHHFDETNRLLKETEQRNAELAVINSVQDGLVREMDMQGIYELVGEKIREIFNAQLIDIVTYDPEANLIEDRYSYEKRRPFPAWTAATTGIPKTYHRDEKRTCIEYRFR
jgi:hypothetical protein